MGKLQNRFCLVPVMIVVISAIACQAYQHSNSDYSENLNQQHSTKQQAHRHHHQHHQHHKLDSVSLGSRNSSRYSLITGSSSTGNNYYQPPTNNYHYQFHNTGSTDQRPHSQHHNQHHQPSRPSVVTQHNVRRLDNPGNRSKYGGPSKPPKINNSGNTAGLRPVKRMLKNNNHHPRNITG